MAAHSTNRSMFRRLVRRLLFANRGRLFVVLLALSAGAAVSAALLNLQVDAKRRLTTEFRTLGANVIISARYSGDFSRVLDESLFNRIPDNSSLGSIAKAEFLYGVVDVSVEKGEGRDSAGASAIHRAVLVGYAHSNVRPKEVLSPALIDTEDQINFLSSLRCFVGHRVASVLALGPYGTILLSNGSEHLPIGAVVLPSTGGPEDDQIFLYLDMAQKLLTQQHRVSTIQLSVPGDPEQVERFIEALQSQLGDAEGHPLRQFTEAQAKIYSRISGLLTAATAIILILTALCVMAAMTNIAAERKHDVGMMKAIGGSARGILNLFLTEAILLGLIGGLIGASAGIALSMVLGKAVFGVAALPRLIVYPISVTLTVIVAILGAYPLRMLANVRPATIFRGEA